MKYYKALLFCLLGSTFLYGQKPTLILPVGHIDAITCLNYSSDGAFIVSGSKDRTIKIWNEKGRLLRNFPTHTTEVVDAFFSPNGEYVFSRSDSTLFMWTFNGALVWQSSCFSPPNKNSFTDYDRPQFSPDGQYLLSLKSDSIPYLLQLNKQRVEELPTLGWQNLSFSPNGQQILSSKGDQILLYNRSSKSLKNISVEHQFSDLMPDFKVIFKDDKNLAIAFADESLHESLEDSIYFKPHFLPTGAKNFKRFESPLVDYSVSRQEFAFFSTGGPAHGPIVFKWMQLLPNSQSGELLLNNSRWTWLWDEQTQSGKDLNTLFNDEGNTITSTALSFSPNESHLGLLYDQQLGIYDMKTGGVNLLENVPLVSSSFPYGNWPHAFAFAPSKQEFVVGSEKEGIAIYNYEGKLIRRLGNQQIKQPYAVHKVADESLEFYFLEENRKIYHQDSLLRIVYDLGKNYVVKNDSVATKLVPRKTKNNFVGNNSSITMNSSAKFGVDDVPGAAPYFYTGSGVVYINSNLDTVPSFFFRASSSISDLGLAQQKYLLTADYIESPRVWSFGCLSNTKFQGETFEDLTLEEVLPCSRSVLQKLPIRTRFLDFSTDKPLVLFKEDDKMLIEDYRGRQIYKEIQQKNFTLLNVEKESTVDFAGHDLKLLGAILLNQGQFALSWSEDHSCKIWDTATGEELLSLFWVNDNDWVVLAPNGLFDASPGLMNLLYYTIGDEIIELEQLKARYYEPGLLPKTLAYSEERIRPVDQLNELRLYPEIVNPTIEKNVLSFQLKARNGGIGRASIFINGKEIIEEANPIKEGPGAKRETNIQVNLQPYNSYFLNAPGSNNLISIQAYNDEGWLKSQTVDLNYIKPKGTARGITTNSGSASWQGQLEPKLYVVSIGTSDYTGTTLDLQYADQDATMIAKAMHYVGGALFNSGDSLEINCLSTAKANATGLEGTAVQWQFADKKNIQATFQAIKNKAKAEDIILVYLSGHGVAYGNAEQTQFHYLTQGIASQDLSDPSIRSAYTISSEELTEWINDIPALKQVLIIDACNSGQIVENLTSGSKSLNSGQIRALDRMKDRTGMFIISGSASDKVSYEASEYGQGLLTYALLQGMLGVATQKDATGNDMVDVMKLFQHARNTVPELAASIQGIQTPMLGFPSQGASFDIGILNDDGKTNIPIGNKKPVMIRSVFINENTLLDDLQLARLLEIEFREEGEEGNDADLIYVDVTEYPKAYRLGALYKTTPDQIDIRVNLFQGQELIKELTIRPTDDPRRLIKMIVREVKKVLKK